MKSAAILCAIVIASLLIADIWLGDYCPGLNGIVTIPRNEFTLYNGMTSPSLKVLALYHTGMPVEVTCNAVFTLAAELDSVFTWSNRCITANVTDATVHRGYIEASYQSFTQRIFFAAYNTNNSCDIDHDWIADAWENANGLSTNISTDAREDWDGDGTNNIFAFVLGISPGQFSELPDSNNTYYADSDADGIWDGWEYNNIAGSLTYFSHDGDYDSDGLTDFEEFILGTNPCLADSDADGIPDGWDVNPLGANPTPIIIVNYPVPGSAI